MEVTLDETDRILLEQLHRDGRTTSADLAQLSGLSPSGVQKRLRRLQERGVVKKVAAVIDRKRLGYDLLVFVQVTLQGHTPESVAHFDQAMRKMGEVLEAHRVTGLADYLLKVVVRDHEHLDHFLMHQLLSLPSVERVNTNIVLKEIKEPTIAGLIAPNGAAGD